MKNVMILAPVATLLTAGTALAIPVTESAS